MRLEVGKGEKVKKYRIHWGSSVISSPGVMTEVEDKRARFVGRELSSMVVSPSESRDSSSEEEAEESCCGLAGAGGRIIKGISTNRDGPVQVAKSKGSQLCCV